MQKLRHEIADIKKEREDRFSGKTQGPPESPPSRSWHDKDDVIDMVDDYYNKCAK
jgi:hypothetical protein